MKDQLAALISLISSGCMTDEEIARIADEAAQAYADPAAFLAANPGWTRQSERRLTPLEGGDGFFVAVLRRDSRR